jgi:hypothetical protein
MELLYWDATGPALRGHAEARIVPQGTALSIFRRAVDFSCVRDVDSSGVSLRVESRNRRRRTEDGSQNRDDGWILRGRAGQLCASNLVAGSSHVAARMDARHVGRRDPGCGGRGFLVLRIEADGNARTGSYQGMPSGMPKAAVIGAPLGAEAGARSFATAPKGASDFEEVRHR